MGQCQIRVPNKSRWPDVNVKLLHFTVGVISAPTSPQTSGRGSLTQAHGGGAEGGDQLPVHVKMEVDHDLTQENSNGDTNQNHLKPIKIEPVETQGE